MKALRVAFAWIVVAIPLGWGLARSLQKAAPLLQMERRSGSSTNIPSVKLP